MIQTLEDHYRWDTIAQAFVLLEQEPGLVDVRPTRTNVQAARVGAGWELMTTVTDVEVNAQPGLIDVWIRPLSDFHLHEGGQRP